MLRSDKGFTFATCFFLSALVGCTSSSDTTGSAAPPSPGGNGGEPALSAGGTAPSDPDGNPTATPVPVGIGGEPQVPEPPNTATPDAGVEPPDGGGPAPVEPIDPLTPGVIVVIGSSTAAGQGPTDPNNAWVPRYQAYLAEEFPNFKLTNLAVGGFSTYEVQPSDFTPPAERPGPAIDNNITAALDRMPDIIVLNLPSNDQARGYSWDEQLANYNRVASLATNAGVQLWVTTTQPRNFAEQEKRDALIQARDNITTRFGNFTIDVWGSFAEPDGRIKPEFNSGDGTHLNDVAHGVWASLIIAKEVPHTWLRSSMP